MMKWLIGLLAITATVLTAVNAFVDGRIGWGVANVVAAVVLLAMVVAWAVLARGSRRAEG